MAKGNFGKSFVGGLSPYLHSTSNLIARMILQNAGYDREEEERQTELKQKEFEQERGLRGFQKLLQGGEFKQELVPSIKEKSPSRFPMQNFGNKYGTENTTQEFFQPTNPIEEAIMYGKLPDDLRSAYKFHQEKNKPEKPEELKVLFKNNFFDSDGKGYTKIRYTDGTEEDIPNGDVKTYKTDPTTKEKIKEKKKDLKVFHTTLDNLEKENANAQVADQVDVVRGQIIRSRNLLRSQSLVEEHPDAQLQLNKHFDNLKIEYGEDKFTVAEKTYPKVIKDKFIKSIMKKLNKGEITIDEFRLLKIWSDFKYGG